VSHVRMRVHLPITTVGHGMDHIQNASSNTFSVVACAYFGHCLEINPLVAL
jgi:hypothetical protein